MTRLQARLKAKRSIAELKRAINFVISEELAEICTPEECHCAADAYLKLNQLRNSLHRHLI